MVVAHELGHVRYRDVPRNVAYAALIAPAAAFAVQQLSWASRLERGTRRRCRCWPWRRSGQRRPSG